jgi:hypothetical protein
MAEKQSGHRQGLENIALRGELRNSLLGIIAGGIIGITGLVMAGLCIINGYEWGGVGIGGATLGSLVWTFIYGTRQRRLEREQKYQLR